MRLLCDISKEGQEFLRNYLSVGDVAFARAHNHDEPWKSVMLSTVTLEDLFIYVMRMRGYYIWRSKDDAQVMALDAEEQLQWFKWAEDVWGNDLIQAAVNISLMNINHQSDTIN